MNYLDQNIYHVYNRGAHRERIFFSEENYRFCLRLFRKYKNKYRVDIIAYCLMPNHYHLLLRQEEGGSISRFLQTTFNTYVQALNKEQGLSGALFEGSAKSVLIDSESSIVRVVRHIHLNPVVAKLVSRPGDWEFSDYNVWITGNASQYPNLKIRDAYFSSADEYKQYVEEYQHEREQVTLENLLFDED